MAWLWWIGAAVGGSLALTAAILVVVFGAVRRSIAAAAAALDDVELDSGPTTMVSRFRDFRSERWVRLGGYRRNPVRAVLTATHLHLLQQPQRYGIFTHADLGRFTVGVHEGHLHLHTDDPPGATGSLTYELTVDDPQRWARALVDAGATPAS